MRSTVGRDWAFVRNWGVLLVPAWGFAGWAGWHTTDTLHDAVMGVLWIGFLCFMVPLVCGMKLDNRSRVRRAGIVYMAGFSLYILLHAVGARLS